MSPLSFLTNFALLGALLTGAQSALAEPWSLHTRANNIQCIMGDEPGKTSMMCSLTRRTGPLALPKPEDCAQLWGYSYFLSDAGPAQMLCLGKATENWRGNGRFDPGQIDMTGIICNATRNTLECTNRDGHGFYLSRREQRVF